jgi:adenylyl-sulfate kinase
MINIQAIRHIVEAAGEIIMPLDDGERIVQSSRHDFSPISQNLVVERQMLDGLYKLTPEIPALSKESARIHNENHERSPYHWLVTVLRNPKLHTENIRDVTLHIALIKLGEPIMGVVHAPAIKVSYWGAKDKGAFKSNSDGTVQSIHAHASLDQQKWPSSESNLFVSAQFDALIANVCIFERDTTRTSLDTSMVAEDSKGFYKRVGLSSGWDIAAAHAVVSAAGGQLVSWNALEQLDYGPGAEINTPIDIALSIPRSGSSTAVGTLKEGIVYERREHTSKAEVIWHHTQVSQTMRAVNLNQRPRCIWLTGLSGSGKSTIANALELQLHKAGRHTYLLDGDNVRQGLNSDLGMSAEDRAENIRRVGEVAKLMVDAGMIVVTAFISPYRADRDKVRALFSNDDFLEVFVDTPLEECERRDVKGLYAKARRGELKEFTGIDSVYERPVDPHVHLLPGEATLQQCVESLVEALDDA